MLQRLPKTDHLHCVVTERRATQTRIKTAACLAHRAADRAVGIRPLRSSSFGKEYTGYYFLYMYIY